MAEKVQCPNCGGYKTQVHTTVIDRKSGKPADQIGCLGWGLITLLIIGAVGYLISGGERVLSLASVILGILLAIFLHSLTLIRNDAKVRKANRIEKYDYTCDLCGYEWSRRADESLPPVTVRPDLIAKGAQKLEEEEEERKRRDDIYRS